MPSENAAFLRDVPFDLCDKMVVTEANGPGAIAVAQGHDTGGSAPMPAKRNDHPSFVKLARTMRRWGNPRLVEHAFSGSPDGQMAAQMVLRERGIRTHDHLGEPLGRAAVEANVQTVKDVLSRDRRTR